VAGYGNFDKKDKSPKTWQVMETLIKKDKSPGTWQVLETLTKKRESGREINERPALVTPSRSRGVKPSAVGRLV
jgi:hypothetical protein